MADERPDDDKGMFFVGMEFAPTEQLKQSDLNRLVVHIFRRFFRNEDGEPMEIKEFESSMLTLVQFLVDLGIKYNEKAFSELPDDLKRHFMVVHRDGAKYRYGSRPRRF